MARAPAPLTITRASEESAWSAREGDGDAAVADGERVQSLLDRLRDVRALDVEDRLPPTPATGTIVVAGVSGELARATWGPLPPQGGEEAVWVTTPQRPGALFRVPAAAFGPVPSRAAELSPP